MTVPLNSPILFVIGTLMLLWFSRHPLRQRNSHGFFRFFAWEAILGLIVLNREVVGGQIISQTLLIISALLLVFGYGAIIAHGRANPQRGDAALYGWERTTALITRGIFGVIRHPMYSSLLLLAWAFFFRAVSVEGGALALFASYFLFRTAVTEEGECLVYFGDCYAKYMQCTRRFIPFLY